MACVELQGTDSNKLATIKTASYNIYVQLKLGKGRLAFNFI
jgi:hypothetical protein